MASLGMRLMMLSFALHALANALVTPRQYDPYPEDGPPSALQCIERSLTFPNWHIFGSTLVSVNGSSGGSTGDFKFLANNKATGEMAECKGKDIELDPKGPASLEVWHKCNDTRLEFQFNLTSFEMRLRGSWVCEESSPFLFSAGGIWEEPVIQGCFTDEGPRGEEQLCIMGNSQVSGRLSSPVSISPQLPLYAYTPFEPARRCVDRSYDPEWVVDDFSYKHHSSQLEGKAEKYYDLSVTLTSTSTGEKAACVIKVDELRADPKRSNAWVKCSPSSQPNALTASTEILLDPEYGILGVRQAWRCTDGIEGIDLENYTGTGYLTSPLVCASPRTINIQSTDGHSIGTASEYNCSLSPAPSGSKIRFSGYSPEAPTMPHTYYQKSCTLGSLLNTTSIDLQEYVVETTDGKSTATLSLRNPGTGDRYLLSKLAIVDDGQWHDCHQSGDGATLPWQLERCQYSLDRVTGKIGVHVQWFCDDRDPDHAQDPV
ncbi:hypothetical protein OQA88_8879 [Cercophora sp. LCS_1]